MKYNRNIDKYLLEFDNQNPYVGLIGIAMRQMVGRTISREAIWRLSTIEYPLYNECMVALRECARREETSIEELSWRQDSNGRHSDNKWKREDKNRIKSKK